MNKIYIWAWNKRPTHPDQWHPGNRKEQKCTVLARGAMNSAHVRFDDGSEYITSRNGLRKGK